MAPRAPGLDFEAFPGALGLGARGAGGDARRPALATSRTTRSSRTAGRSSPTPASTPAPSSPSTRSRRWTPPSTPSTTGRTVTADEQVADRQEPLRPDADGAARARRRRPGEGAVKLLTFLAADRNSSPRSWPRRWRAPTARRAAAVAAPARAAAGDPGRPRRPARPQADAADLLWFASAGRRARLPHERCRLRRRLRPRRPGLRRPAPARAGRSRPLDRMHGADVETGSPRSSKVRSAFPSQGGVSSRSATRNFCLLHLTTSTASSAICASSSHGRSSPSSPAPIAPGSTIIASARRSAAAARPPSVPPSPRAIRSIASSSSPCAVASGDRSEPHVRQSWTRAQRWRTSSVVSGSTARARTAAAAKASIASSSGQPQLMPPPGRSTRGPTSSAHVAGAATGAARSRRRERPAGREGRPGQQVEPLAQLDHVERGGEVVDRRVVAVAEHRLDLLVGDAAHRRHELLGEVEVARSRPARAGPQELSAPISSRIRRRQARGHAGRGGLPRTLDHQLEARPRPRGRSSRSRPRLVRERRAARHTCIPAAAPAWIAATKSAGCDASPDEHDLAPGELLGEARSPAAASRPRAPRGRPATRVLLAAVDVLVEHLVGSIMITLAPVRIAHALSP